MPLESIKRTECVKVCFTEREIVDLNREAVRENRRLADLVYVMVRASMYGRVGQAAPAEEVTRGD
jgi:hypothetical protein